MKPAEQLEQLANEFAQKCDPLNQTLEKQADLRQGYKAGFMEAISQMQPEWVACDLNNLPTREVYYSIWCKGYSPCEMVARLTMHHTFKVPCFMDNYMNIYKIGEIATHWKPLSQPPTK